MFMKNYFSTIITTVKRRCENGHTNIFFKTLTYNTQKMEKQTEENKKSRNRLLRYIVVTAQPVLFRVNNIEKRFYKFTQNN